MKELLLCTAIISVMTLSLFTFTKAQCQAQSMASLNKMLMNTGGTLNSQIVATNWIVASKFKSHFSTNKLQKVAITKRRVEMGLDMFAEKVIRKFSRRSRRSIGTTVIRACYSPLLNPQGTAPNLLHQLCHTCDATTTLPSNFYPRYINQVVCDPAKPAVCFQGEGECKARFMALTFLVKTGNCVNSSSGIFLEEWTPVVINVGICCECMIKTSSIFKFFI